MLKLKAFDKIAALYAVCCMAAIFLLFSCSSLPRSRVVLPSELITQDKNFNFYADIKSNNQALEDVFSGIVEKDSIKWIESHVDKVYCSFNSVSDFDAVLRGNFPVSFLSLALTEKKGWSKSAVNGSLFSYTVYHNKKNNIDLCSLNSELMVISSDISPVIDLYEVLCQSEKPLSDDKDSFICFTQKYPEEICIEFFNGDGIYSFTAGEMYIPPVISNVKCRIYQSDDHYLSEAYFVINNPLAVKAGVTMLKLALLSTSAKIEQTDFDIITVSDLIISKDMLISFRSNLWSN